MLLGALLALGLIVADGGPLDFAPFDFAQGRRGRQAPAQRAAPPAPRPRPPIILVTLDTTRADALGCYGRKEARTPTLDGLATRGVRYARALTPCPLTLVAHASLLTGRLPPEHGVHDNGTAVLPRDLPTLAERLRAMGYATAAFVASRVLDRRFGLDRGFDVYDDRMAAEQVGEYGYPERSAAEVTDAAIRFIGKRASDEPYFLWIHYYDPHSPYTPPAGFGGSTDAERYAGEIAYADRELGRLLHAAPGQAGGALIAAVADHGEALGEHGERAHGILLHDATLRVPMILAGPGVEGGVVEESVTIRRLGATILDLVGDAPGAKLLGGALPLPGKPSATGGDTESAIYAETEMPARAYGWSPLRAWVEGRYKLVAAPRPELFDVRADPGELKNLHAREPRVVARMNGDLDTFVSRLPRADAAAPAPDAALRESLQSLGYVGGQSGGEAAPIDPKDGIPWLQELESAKKLLDTDPRAARKVLQDLCKRSPGNVPFLTQLARAELRSGDGEAAIATYRKAIQRNPTLDFLYLNLGEALHAVSRDDEARAALQKALDRNPRFAPAWMDLAQLSEQAGLKEEARKTLEAAVERGTDSAMLLTWLAEKELSAGDGAAGDAHLAQALELQPRFVAGLILKGERAENLGQQVAALDAYGRAADADPGSALAFFHLGKLYLKRGDRDAARAALDRAIAIDPAAPEAARARRLLEGSTPP